MRDAALRRAIADSAMFQGETGVKAAVGNTGLSSEEQNAIVEQILKQRTSLARSSEVGERRQRVPIVAGFPGCHAQWGEAMWDPARRASIMASCRSLFLHTFAFSGGLRAPRKSRAFSPVTSASPSAINKIGLSFVRCLTAPRFALCLAGLPPAA